MNLQIIYQLEDERGAFLFKQQLGVCFGSFTDPDVSNLSARFLSTLFAGLHM